MQAFDYVSPSTKEEVVALLASEWGKTEVLAGGTDLISLMKDHVVSPIRLVSLKQVKELKGISFRAATGLRVGAMTTLQELIDHGEIRQHYPALVQAANGVRSPQIRSVGTVAGDLCQRPRCWYFRNGFGLLALHNGKSLVLDGDNRYHAILGNSGPAYFVNPSSLAPILMALGARVHLYGPQGARELPVADFFAAPQNEHEREHLRKPNEIVVAVSVPPPNGAKMAVYEVWQKEALDWPLVAAAVALRLEGTSVKSAHVVLGHVAPVPWPSPEAERALVGKTITEEVAAAAGRAAVSNARPLSKNAYKIQLARVAVKRAILRAATGEV